MVVLCSKAKKQQSQDANLGTLGLSLESFPFHRNWDSSSLEERDLPGLGSCPASCYLPRGVAPKPRLPLSSRWGGGKCSHSVSL